MIFWPKTQVGLIVVALTMAFFGCEKKLGQNPPSPLVPPVTEAQPENMHIAVVFQKKEASVFRDRFKRGAEEAAKDVGDMTLTFHEPDVSTAAAQAKIMDLLRVQAAKVQVLEAADPYACAPEIRKIRLQEIQVVTLETDCDSDRSRRLYFLNPYPTAQTGELLAQLAAREIGGKGEMGIVGGLALSIQYKSLQDKITKTIHTDFPGITLVDPVFTEDLEEKAKAQTQQLLKDHPQIQCILVLSRVVLPAVARAVEAAKSHVAVIGLGRPSETREFVQRGTVRYLVTWNPEQLGYFTVRASRRVANLEISLNHSFLFGRTGVCVMDDDEMPLAEPIVVTADTVSAYDY